MKPVSSSEKNYSTIFVADCIMSLHIAVFSYLQVAQLKSAELLISYSSAAKHVSLVLVVLCIVLYLVTAENQGLGSQVSEFCLYSIIILFLFCFHLYSEGTF